MKCLLLFLFGLLLAVGCASTPTTVDDVHNEVLKADKAWVEYAQYKRPSLWSIGIVNRERKMYEKILKTDAKPWQKRRAGWNYIFAVRDAQIPVVPQPPGRGSVQPNPFY